MTIETKQRQNCDVIVIFPIDGQFGAIRTPDSEHIVCKTYIFISSNLILKKLKTKNLTEKHSSYDIALNKGTMIAKNDDYEKILTSAKLRGPWH